MFALHSAALRLRCVMRVCLCFVAFVLCWVGLCCVVLWCVVFVLCRLPFVVCFYGGVVLSASLDS